MGSHGAPGVRDVPAGDRTARPEGRRRTDAEPGDHLMRIGIDARELCGRATGVGRYLSGLLTTWAADAGTRRHEFVLYTPEALTIRLDAHRFPTRLVPGAPSSWWEQVRLPRVAQADRLD